MKKTLKTIDAMSLENQRIREKWVENNVKACLSMEMQAMLEKEIISWDDVENLYLYTCPDCGHQQNDQNEDLYGGFCNSESGETKDELEFKCPSCEKSFSQEPELEPQEIYEWWIVSEYFYEELKKSGQPVLEFGLNFYWGRTCTGQAIYMDSIISKICIENNLLK